MAPAYHVHYTPRFSRFLFVVDLDLPGHPSVTNCAPEVVAAVLRHPEADGLGTRIIYRDALQVWDELRHDGARFICFAAVSPMDWTALAPALNEAVRAAEEVAERGGQ